MRRRDSVPMAASISANRTTSSGFGFFGFNSSRILEMLKTCQEVPESQGRWRTLPGSRIDNRLSLYQRIDAEWTT